MKNWLYLMLCCAVQALWSIQSFQLHPHRTTRERKRENVLYNLVNALIMLSSDSITVGESKNKCFPKEMNQQQQRKKPSEREKESKKKTTTTFNVRVLLSPGWWPILSKFSTYYTNRTRLSDVSFLPQCASFHRIMSMYCVCCWRSLGMIFRGTQR